MPLKVQRDDQTAINLTPMIDIVFLLIIFFMVSSHFTNKSHAERDIAISVPQVSDAGALTAPPRHRVINIYDDGKIALDEDILSVAELGAKLKEAKKNYADLGVIVRGDGAVQYERVAEVISTVEDLKIRNVNITVRKRDAVIR